MASFSWLSVIVLLVISLSIGTECRGEVRWHEGFQGDPRAVGRGGAGTVLSDNLWGVFDNPAGSALIAPGTTLQLSNNSIVDRFLPMGEETIRLSSGGIVLPETPWGFSGGVFSYEYSKPVREYFLNGSHLF